MTRCASSATRARTSGASTRRSAGRAAARKLLYEAESSARQNAAVAMKWSALFDKEIPQELLHEIELQKDTCERIIQSKDRLIKEFKTELKAKDDEYAESPRSRMTMESCSLSG